MEVFQICKKFLPSKAIEQRFNNKQLKLNNEIIQNLSIDIDIDDEFNPIDLGTFLVDHFPKEFLVFGKLFNIRDFFGPGDTNIEKLKLLSNFIIITLSKKEEFVLKLKI